MPFDLRQQPVFVVTTLSKGAPRPHLFGVHSRDKAKDHYQSRVFGFTDREHAVRVAKGLETYHRHHGCFPPRDRKPKDMQLRGIDPDIQLEAVRVEEVMMRDLLHRLQGSGIMLSVLKRDTDTPGSSWIFEVKDVPTNQTTGCVVAALNRTWHAGDKPKYVKYKDLNNHAGVKTVGGVLTLVDGVPMLLPKPRWPPLARSQTAAAETGRVNVLADAPIVVQVLAASMLKFVALAEVMALFYLFPKLLS